MSGSIGARADRAYRVECFARDLAQSLGTFQGENARGMLGARSDRATRIAGLGTELVGALGTFLAGEGVWIEVDAFGGGGLLAALTGLMGVVGPGRPGTALFAAMADARAAIYAVTGEGPPEPGAPCLCGDMTAAECSLGPCALGPDPDCGVGVGGGAWERVEAIRGVLNQIDALRAAVEEL